MALLHLAGLALLALAGHGPGPHARSGAADESGRLTVRPHEMATGTRNTQAGVRLLKPLDSAVVYVPAKCVGTRRVPLVVLIHGGGVSAQEMIDRQRQFADKYGMIILAPNAPAWGGMGRHWVQPEENLALVDSAMKLVLREYAIDPDKIAITGMSEGGRMALWLGRNNLDVFSRVAPESPAGYSEGGGPQNMTTQFLLMAGTGESDVMWEAPFQAVRQERQAGRLAEIAILIRGHAQRTEDEAIVWEWLQKSWAKPKVAVLTAQPADSTVVLTADMLKRLTDFWKRFVHESQVTVNTPNDKPESDSMMSPTGRRANQHRISMLVGQERVVVPMMDLAALAAKNPAVAADLKAAGLTAAQAGAYRVALLSALATAKTLGAEPGTVAPGSALARNLAFVKEHRSELDTLDQEGMWAIP